MRQTKEEFGFMAFHISALVLGFLLDLAFGDPRWLYHPIRLIGN